jgi:uncharacterized surface protein with fasciclin (FAS1) repeats
MNRFLGTLAIILALSVSPAFAHCGSCGTGDEHSHATKANVGSSDIVDVAMSAGTFNTLLAAAKAAGLVDTLKSSGPFTVFAPTDEAFAKLPAGTVEALLADPVKLKAILLYHVVSGEVTADQVVKLSTATTVEGSDVRIKVKGSKVMIDNATVLTTDVMASNGVIHVIDTVMIPAA